LPDGDAPTPQKLALAFGYVLIENKHNSSGREIGGARNQSLTG
jgi:hypothetical protein